MEHTIWTQLKRLLETRPDGQAGAAGELARRVALFGRQRT